MVLIFGWGAGEAQDLGEVAPAVCPNCHNHVFMHHIKSEKKVSLYFVPLIPYGTDEYLACPTCRHGLQLRPEQRDGGREHAVGDIPVPARPIPSRDLRDRASSASGWRSAWHRRATRWCVRLRRSRRPGARERDARRPPLRQPPPPEASLSDRLQGLAKLHADGVLTDEEFAAAKRRLLDI